jgi:hypothetical protein
MKNSVKDVYIYLLLSTKINEPNIITKIINDSKKMEDIETLEYHYERWVTIAGSYFKCIDRLPFTSSRNYYSYVLNSEKYIYEKDRILDYYKETGVSFQTRELLLDIIVNDILTSNGTCDKYICNLSGESKDMREKNDKMYYPLSELIMDSMPLLSK